MLRKTLLLSCASLLLIFAQFGTAEETKPPRGSQGSNWFGIPTECFELGLSGSEILSCLEVAREADEAAPPAFEASVEAIKGFETHFESQSKVWNENLKPAALRLLYTLASISLALQFIGLVLKGSDFGEIVQTLTVFILVVGFFSWVITNSTEFSASVLDGFRELAGIANKGLSADSLELESISPAGVLERGFIIAVQITNTDSSFVDGVINYLMALLIIIVFALIAAALMVVLIESWVVTAAGVIFLGFGGFEQTRNFAIQYLTYLISVGAKVYVLLLIVGTGDAAVTNWITEIPVFTIESFLGLFGLLVLQLVLVQQVPSIVQGMVSGASIGGGNVLGTALQLAAFTAGAAKFLKSSVAKPVGSAAAGATQALRLTSAQRSSGDKQGSYLGQVAKNIASAIGENSAQKQTTGSSPTLGQTLASKRLGLGAKVSGDSGSISSGDS